MILILIDADACPVKDEVYKVAWRYGVRVVLVSNSPIRIPDHPLISRKIVSDSFDAADDWIVDQLTAIMASSTATNPSASTAPKIIIITADILLADRCLKSGAAAVIAPNGKPFTADSIGNAVAVRAIMADLRAGAVGEAIGGPPPFAKADRSRFLSALDQQVVRLTR